VRTTTVEATLLALRLDTRALLPSPVAENVCVAPVDATPLASIAERTLDDEGTAERLDDEATAERAPAVSAPPVRVVLTRPRRPASSQVRSPLLP
jgi:hypothetical protein